MHGKTFKQRTQAIAYLPIYLAYYVVNTYIFRQVKLNIVSNKNEAMT